MRDIVQIPEGGGSCPVRGQGIKSEYLEASLESLYLNSDILSSAVACLAALLIH
jgi:hypothetical protein